MVLVIRGFNVIFLLTEKFHPLTVKIDEMIEFEYIKQVVPFNLA